MSAFDPKRTCAGALQESALWGKADILRPTIIEGEFMRFTREFKYTFFA